MYASDPLVWVRDTLRQQPGVKECEFGVNTKRNCIQVLFTNGRKVEIRASEVMNFCD